MKQTTSRKRRVLAAPISKSKVLAKTQSRCAYCGTGLTARTMQRDHVEPLGRYKKARYTFGGHNGCAHPERHCVENIVAACAACNKSKGALDLETWRGTLKWVGATPLHPVVFWFERMQRSIDA